MAFVYTWNATFEAVPADTDDAREGALRIRDHKKAVSERLEVDHSWAGDADDGKHLQLTMPELAADPSNVATTGFVYTKDVSGATELFYEDAAGNILQLSSTGNAVAPLGNAGQVVSTNAAETGVAQWAPKYYISGLELSNNSTDALNDIDIAAGEASDSGNAYVFKLTSGLTKQIDATWAAGDAAGGLFSGSVAADTTYHVFLIHKTADGTIDVGFDTSVTAANIPSGYIAYRRIGSIMTNGSSEIIAFLQTGNEFILDVPVEDVNITNPGNTAITAVLSVPIGVIFRSIKYIFFVDGSVGADLLVTSLDQTDTAPTAAIYHIRNAYDGITLRIAARFITKTDVNASIRYRLAQSDSTTFITIVTIGWLDERK